MRILIANPFGIGDVLATLPLLHALRDFDSHGFLGFLCNRRTSELVEGWPFVDRVYVFEKDTFRAFWRESLLEGLRYLGKLIDTIRQQPFDVLVDLSLGWQYGLAGRLAGIPKRIGFDFHGRGKFLTDRFPLNGFHHQPVAHHYLELLTPLGIRPRVSIRHSFDLPETVREEAAEYLKSQDVGDRDSIVGIVPGGGASWGPQAVFKQWPAERFAQVAAHVAKRYRARILLLGDSEEAFLCQAIAHTLSPSAAILAVQVPSLLLLAGLLKRCALVIGNDSGPMHLAASVGTKTVTIFGPVDGTVYGPQGNGHRTVAKGLACRPCYQGFRFPPCPWDNACLKGLTVAEVLETIDQLFGKERADEIS